MESRPIGVEMKTAIYVEDGELQLVLTPETDFEKDVTKRIETMGTIGIKIMRGHFYPCMGGYITQDNSNESLILRAIKPNKIIESPQYQKLFNFISDNFNHNALENEMQSLISLVYEHYPKKDM